MFVNVAVSIPSAGPFTYGVPDGMEGQMAVGQQVLVPLGRRNMTGYIVELIPETDIPSVKSIIDLLDTEPLFDAQDLAFYRWISEYYLYPLGKTLKAALPGGIDVESSRWVRLSGDRQGNDNALSSEQHAVLEILADHPRGLSFTGLKKITRGKGLVDALQGLQDLHRITVGDRIGRAAVTKKQETRVALRSPLPPDIRLTEKQRAVCVFLERHGETDMARLRSEFRNARATIRRMEEKGLLDITAHEVYRSPASSPRIGAGKAGIRLNREQETALEEITRGIASRRYCPCLLHGVTGSGKTEVYLKAIEETLLLGGSAIYLVPEITLTPQLMSRVRDRFDGGMIAVLHSGIGPGARYDEWRRIRRGEARIVVGARSAIFAPVRDLRLIIVDEEHDTSYKQEEYLPYNARDLAIVRARQRSATVILGSATPAVQTYFNTQKRDFKLLELTRRVAGRDLPRVDIIDMKKEGGRTPPLFSRSLIDAVGETLGAGNQALLFLNRRGFHTFLCCLDCGYVFTCLNCAVSLTHHRNDGFLRCHYCDFRVKAPPICPACGGSRIRSYGIGTERVEEEVVRLFPGARVRRMDSDSTSKRGEYARILTALDRGEIDVLVGTQMITKGHDFPRVTLVGVVSADTSLNIPDFRAAEKTFQLLTQVSGRGGRGDAPGRVLIQTVNPDNSAIQQARRHDYIGFYHDEIVMRRELDYPPFGRMVNLIISSTNKAAALDCVKKLHVVARDLAREAGGGISVLGPAEAPLSKVKGRYRWQLLLKGAEAPALHSLASQIVAHGSGPGLRIKVDVDPVNFM
ncbi:MAG: primosomal protein N' [Deltaproteobacteria bacterium]|nr:primosomal protein N' [Deltaproteobacteria bacterium]